MNLNLPEASVYIAKKTVLATPMTEATFQQLMQNGGLVPQPDEPEVPEEVGFMVEVPEGVSNHKDFSGHLSWMPYAEFLYRHQAIGPHSTTPAFIQRMQVEQVQLDQRLKDLLQYTKSDAFGVLSHNQRELLLEQARVMLRYSYVLNERIQGHLAQIAHKLQAEQAHTGNR